MIILGLHAEIEKFPLCNLRGKQTDEFRSNEKKKLFWGKILLTLMYSISLESIWRLWNLGGSWKSSIIGSTTTFGPVAPAGLLDDAAPGPDGADAVADFVAAAAATNQQKHNKLGTVFQVSFG